MSSDTQSSPGRKPPWLRVRLGQSERVSRLREIVRGGGLHTVCEEALCPNLGRCWEKGRATIMILGDSCTRNCRFCNVHSRPAAAIDSDEPARVAEVLAAMDLRDVVLTSVTRDDLPDGGAGLWAETIRCVRDAIPQIVIEVLVPDFEGSRVALETVLAAGPDVLGHNLETVPSLYPRVRPQADYRRSLAVLEQAHAAGFITKTGIMAGLGETMQEIRTVMGDAVQAGCDIFYAGQYLQPSDQHLPVQRYVAPSEFEEISRAGRTQGFKVVVAAPLVRSSYHSDEQAAFVAQRKATR